MLKQCRYCRNWYDEEDFGVAKTTPEKIYRRHKCKTCYRETKKKLHRRNREWLDNYKRGHGCSLCDEHEPCCLEFHHTAGDKKSNVSDLAARASKTHMLKEIQKCQLVCSNCHKKIHAGVV